MPLVTGRRNPFQGPFHAALGCRHHRRVRLRCPAAVVFDADEIPVCGSGNGSVTAFIARHKHAGETSGRYVAEQGIEMGRDGEVHASWERDGDALRVHIGGEAIVVASGKLFL